MLQKVQLYVIKNPSMWFLHAEDIETGPEPVFLCLKFSPEPHSAALQIINTRLSIVITHSRGSCAPVDFISEIYI